MLKVLVAYSMSSTHVQTTLDYLLALKRYGNVQVSYVHVTHDAIMNFDFNAFDVVFHNYCARLCYDNYVSNNYRKALRRFKGLKILSVQDEYNRTNNLKAAIRNLGFQVVLTCVPQESLEYVYPRNQFPNVEFVTVFSGYVPGELELAAIANRHVPLEQRPIIVGYRGRDMPAYYGQLGYEKYEIGRHMKEICATRGIANDISVDEESRIYGLRWFNFIGSCRSTLGSESGSNIFDFDGSLERLHDEMTASLGRKISYQEFLPLVANKENEISMGQISPRIFECAVMRTPQILFRGRYSGVIEAEVHYIALNKDFSNADEVLDRLGDIPALKRMADRTYDDLVASHRFSYRAFCRHLVAVIDRKLDELGLPRGASTAVAKNLQTGMRIDPNQWWIELPTDQPLSKEQFDTRQNKWLASIYEPKVRHLFSVLDRRLSVSAVRLERLRRACGISVKRSGPQATATAVDFINDIDESIKRLSLGSHERRSRFECDRQELSVQLDGIGAASEIPSFSAAYSEYVKMHLREIYALESDIDQLDELWDESYSEFEKRMPQRFAVSYGLKYQIFKYRVLYRISRKFKNWLIETGKSIALRVPNAKGFILRTPWALRLVTFIRSRQ